MKTNSKKRFFVPCYKVVIVYDLTIHGFRTEKCLFDYFLKNCRGQSLFEWFADNFAVPFEQTKVLISRVHD